MRGQRACDHAGFGDTELGEPRVVGVVAEHGDACGRRQIHSEQAIGNLIDEGIGLGVSEPLRGGIDRGIGGADQRHFIGRALGHAFDDVADRHAVPTIIVATITNIFYIDAHGLSPVIA